MRRREDFLAAAELVYKLKAEVMARDTPSLVWHDDGRVEYKASEPAAAVMRRCDEVVDTLRALFFDGY